MEAGLVQILEGALLAAGEPLSLQRMAILFEEDERPSTDELRSAIKVVGERCEDRGYELVQVASGYRFQVRQSLSDWVARLWQERPARYSRALMETLSLTRDQVAVVGDDMPDTGMFKHAAVNIAVNDAHPLVAREANWITSLPGGFGAVREISDTILQSQGVEFGIHGASV